MLKFSKLKLISVVITILLSIYLSIPTFFYNAEKNKYLINNKVNFGLDLKGGVSFTIQASLDSYIKEKLVLMSEELQVKLQNNKIYYDNWALQEDYLSFTVPISLNKEQSKKIINCLTRTNLTIKQNNNSFIVNFNDDYRSKLTLEVLENSINILRKRVDSLGTKEVEIQTLGKDMILLKIPGAIDLKKIKQTIGKTAVLTFHIVKNKLTDNISESEKIALLINSKTLLLNDKTSIIIEDKPFMTGAMLEFVSTAYGTLGEPVIRFRLNNIGKKIFASITKNNNGKMIAIVLDNHIISHPLINEPILNGEGIISGSMNHEEAINIASLLKDGSLPIPLKIIEERLIGPALGSQSIESGIKACIISAFLVSVIMLYYYRLFGLITSFALLINLVMIIGTLSIFKATLTLPGVAGIVLTLGMAVDSNILIFERIKEELKKGKTPLHALHYGYKHAFTAIFDSNITTLFVASILYIVGIDSTKGFAITLIIGIICSIFTSVVVTKEIIILWYKINKPKMINL